MRENRVKKALVGVYLTVSVVMVVWFMASVVNVNMNNLSPEGEVANWNILSNTMELLGEK